MKRGTFYLMIITFFTLSFTFQLIGQQNDNKIIFLSDRDGVIQVYAMNSDGSNINRITKSPERKYLPQVSPAGDQVIFSNDESELVICDIDGSNERVISEKKEVCSTPSWSSDGNKIIFASTRGGYKDSDGDPVKNIWIMDVDGTNAQQLTYSNYSHSYPQFSPDNTKIIYRSAKEKFYFKSPVDLKVYFVRRSNIYIMNFDGSDQKRLTALNHGLSYYHAVFSPNGKNIIYTMKFHGADEENEWSHIYIMDINGDHPTRISGIDDYHIWPFYNIKGDRIIYSAFFDGGFKIMKMDTDGSNIVRITKDNYSNHNASFYSSNSNDYSAHNSSLSSNNTSDFSAQDKHQKSSDYEFNMKTSYGIDTQGGSLVMKNGQWVPQEGTNITGQINITVEFDGEEFHFPTNIMGTKMIDDELNYLCENGESFYLVGQTPKVSIEPSFNKRKEDLNSLINAFSMNRSEKLVWDIWKIKSL